MEHQFQYLAEEIADEMCIRDSYYDENEIEVGKLIQCQGAVNHVVELTAEEKAEVRQNAVRRYQEEELRKLQNRSKPRTATKATAQEVQQPNLFNF